MPDVFRAPMRSRLDSVDAAAAVDWALRSGVVGVGEQGSAQELDRIQARLRRFADAADGSFVWTRRADSLLFVGRIDGPLRDDPAGEPFDLRNVRPCRWHGDPVGSAAVPAAVLTSFERGGRNFQRINADGVGVRVARLWDQLSSAHTHEDPDLS